MVAGSEAAVTELVADKGYHDNRLLARCAVWEIRTYMPVSPIIKATGRHFQGLAEQKPRETRLSSRGPVGSVRWGFGEDTQGFF